MHFSTALPISKRWILAFEEVHAKMYYVGWKTMLVISALLLPRFSSWTTSPASVLKIFMTCPRCEAEAIRVPSGFTASAPTSVSCAAITRSILLSTTKLHNKSACYFAANLLTIVQYFKSSAISWWKTYNFWNRFFSLWYGTKSQRIWISINLLNKFESNKIENKCFLCQHNYHHVFP